MIHFEQAGHQVTTYSYLWKKMEAAIDTLGREIRGSHSILNADFSTVRRLPLSNALQDRQGQG